MARPRPFTTSYPGGSIGHSASVRNAIKRATAHLLDNKLNLKKDLRANILHESVHVADVVRVDNSIVITWLRGRLAY